MELLLAYLLAVVVLPLAVILLFIMGYITGQLIYDFLQYLIRKFKK